MSALQTLTLALAAGVSAGQTTGGVAPEAFVRAEADPERARQSEAIGAALDLAQVLTREAGDIAPQIWAACGAEAERVVMEKVRSGELGFGESGEYRERYVRKLALEQAVNYAAESGMGREEISALMAVVMTAEEYQEMVGSTPPSREVIDELRTRMYVLINFDPATLGLSEETPAPL